MNKSFKIIILIFVVSLTAVFPMAIIRAGSGDNTSGYAWSENIGWISFNSLSDGSPIDYGVNIDPDTGDLSGYAWSENIGWISFNRSDTGNPPAAPFNGGSGPIAKYDSGTGALTGWMRVLTNGSGWDGWIKFEDASINASGDWNGWAWSDMVIGWVNLNGADSGFGGDYKVTTTCLDTCASLGYDCGTYTICGKSVNCGSCDTAAGFICVNGKCVLKPTADIKANGSDGPITVDFNTSVNISWTSENTTSCSVYHITPTGSKIIDWTGKSGGPESTGDLTHDIIYTLDCVGAGGGISDSVTVNVNFPFPFWKEIAPF